MCRKVAKIIGVPGATSHPLPVCLLLLRLFCARQWPAGVLGAGAPRRRCSGGCGRGKRVPPAGLGPETLCRASPKGTEGAGVPWARPRVTKVSPRPRPRDQRVGQGGSCRGPLAQASGHPSVPKAEAPRAESGPGAGPADRVGRGRGGDKRVWP